MNTLKFTVFTPTFNRAHTINRVYDSLKKQTVRNFEWVVIDDGSTDKTDELISQWQKESDFQIVYAYQENSGKHAAFNRAVKMARGELFLVIDSDDGFLPDSLESMLHWWMDIPESERSAYTGIVTLCQFVDGTICGEKFPASPLDTNSLALRFKYKVRGETWGFHQTEVLKAYPFPDDKNVRFIPENLIWDDIARKYKIRCINEPLRIFYQDSGNQVTKANPRKKALVKNYFLQILNRDFDYFRHDPKTFLKWAVLYVRYSLHLRDWGFLQVRRFDQVAAYLLCCFVVIPGAVLFLLDTFKNRKN